MAEDSVRWGILGTANIVRRSFLPALAASGNGAPYAIAGRQAAKAQEFAREHGVPHSVEGYETLLRDDAIEAVYIPLPNALHAEWTIKALHAGKAVLCEKPLCISVEETRRVLATAEETGTPLWEAFVFPFQPQMERIRTLLRDGAIGEAREVQSTFHFSLRDRHDIRLSMELAGGALNDVGCYCVALACAVFGAEPTYASAMTQWAPEGVDEATSGVLGFSDDRRLVFSCAMDLPQNTSASVIGGNGELRLSNPFHPSAEDNMELRSGDGSELFKSQQDVPSFTQAIQHINRVMRSLEEPQHLAVHGGMGHALGLELLRRSARSGRVESV